MMTELQFPLYERRWRCEVVSSGFHNGCHCHPDEPHSGWACGYRWLAASLPDTPEAAEFVAKLHWFQSEVVQ